MRQRPGVVENFQLNREILESINTCESVSEEIEQIVSIVVMARAEKLSKRRVYGLLFSISKLNCGWTRIEMDPGIH